MPTHARCPARACTATTAPARFTPAGTAMCDPPTIRCDTCGAELGPATLAATTDPAGHTTGWAWTTDTDHDCPKEPQ